MLEQRIKEVFQQPGDGFASVGFYGGPYGDFFEVKEVIS